MQPISLIGWSQWIHCGEPAGWTELPLGTEAGTGQHQCVLDGGRKPHKQESHKPQLVDVIGRLANAWKQSAVLVACITVHSQCADFIKFLWFNYY